tara:strand:+ start:181 stop:336 length:156 start_codon:yes stop_codon:yes gene_type:complete
MKNLFLYISLGFIFYFSISDSLLKSQKIDCNNGVQLACDLMNTSQKQNKDI